MIERTGDAQFPVPFAGITRLLELDDTSCYNGVLALLGCGHPHNFAVELDGGVDRRVIWTTQMGAECVAGTFKDDDGELLTGRERALIGQIAQVWNGFCSVVDDGPTRSADLQEIAGKIHDLQHAVMAQAAARAHPETYRLLGRHGDWMRS